MKNEQQMHSKTGYRDMEIKEMIYLQEDFLEDFGFELDPSLLHYTKSFSEGKQILFFHHIQNPDANYLEIQLGIRFDRVEEIINQFLPSLGNFRDKSVTHVIPINQIDRNMPKRFYLQNDFEVNDILKRIEAFLVKDGFHWLDKYTVPENMEFLFNKNPDQELTTQNFTYRSARAITLCKLYNEAEYEVTKRAYLDKLKEMMVTPFTLASFLNLLNHLENLD
ncbi:hypothetical protein Belba_2914 [Belliella baltica DSM 15883]|uniref:DUF4304 domain-containing protein n=1 Tax=Belliella baltica (strain DSM 15883 / CIP 108006 / LMG 21964 / BA134) TaxID=866536 RepID=I3Z877_BELBD|nr:hypothetical protein [Belliella baltica]AFL85445.1 hypothetical protein Belba_2914 [Belliella baltica DSM 15883]